MKTIEAIMPESNVQLTVDELCTLHVEDITVEPVKVYKKDLQRMMTYRGCVYHQNFVVESRLQFQVSDEDASQAERIVAEAAHA